MKRHFCTKCGIENTDLTKTKCPACGAHLYKSRRRIISAFITIMGGALVISFVLGQCTKLPESEKSLVNKYDLTDCNTCEREKTAREICAAFSRDEGSHKNSEWYSQKAADWCYRAQQDETKCENGDFEKSCDK